MSFFSRSERWKRIVLGLLVGMSTASVVFLTRYESSDVCVRLFELSGGDALALKQVTREDCETAYRQRRMERGQLGFASLAWCVHRAKSLEEAARC